MANGTKGRDKPLPLDSLPVGGQTRLSPHTPLGNFSGLILSDIRLRRLTGTMRVGAQRPAICGLVAR
jgi:hypothetical protein